MTSNTPTTTVPTQRMETLSPLERDIITALKTEPGADIVRIGKRIDPDRGSAGDFRIMVTLLAMEKRGQIRWDKSLPGYRVANG